MTTQKEQLANNNTAIELQELSKLANEKQSLNDGSPLAIVRDKEVNLRKYLIETQTKADKLVEDAKKEAEKLREKLDLDGEKKAEEHFNSELAKIVKQAEDIRAEAPAKAKAAASTGNENLEKAIEQVKNILIPKF